MKKRREDVGQWCYSGRHERVCGMCTSERGHGVTLWEVTHTHYTTNAQKLAPNKISQPVLHEKGKLAIVIEQLSDLQPLIHVSESRLLSRKKLFLLSIFKDVQKYHVLCKFQFICKDLNFYKLTKNLVCELRKCFFYGNFHTKLCAEFSNFLKWADKFFCPSSVRFFEIID